MDLWQRIADACAYATFFHTPVWAQILKKAYPRRYNIATKAFGFGPKEWVVLPLMESEYELKGFFKSLISNVPGVYGGLISNVPISSKHLDSIGRHLQKARAKRIDIFGNPYANFPQVFPKWEKRENSTHWMRLDRFDDEAGLFKIYTHGARNHVNRAKKRGYRIRLAQSLEDVRAYYGLYKKALTRWGEQATGVQNFELFKSIFEAKSNNILWWMALLDEKVVGGSIRFCYNRSYIAWQSAFLEDEFHFGLPKYLHHYCILDAKQREMSVYDFNPSGGHEGTANFKDMFGAERCLFTGGRWNNNVYKVFKSVRAFFPEHMKDVAQPR